MASTVLTRKNTPPAVNPSDPVTKAQLDASGGGNMFLGEIMRPMKGYWPAVDAVNGPITADAGHTNTTPTLTGLTYYKWDSAGRFNKQSQKWQPVTGGVGGGPVTTGDYCVNGSTNRQGAYSVWGTNIPSIIDFSFIVNTSTIILKYFVQTYGYSGANTSHHETQVFIEGDDGVMRGVRQFPALWAGGSGGGAQDFWRVIKLGLAKRRRVRVLMTPNCLLGGVYVDADANMKAAENLPFFIGIGDSWAEPNGNTFAAVGGNGSIAGVTYPGSSSVLYSNTDVQLILATGWAGALCHHGGTGWTNYMSDVHPNNAGVGFTSFLGKSQWDYSFAQWGAGKPLVIVAGGANDGATPTLPSGYASYQAVVTAGLARPVASDSEIPIIVAGIQDRGMTAMAANEAAIVAACAANSNVIGYINQDNWVSDIPTTYLGPDTLHPTMYGADDIGQFYANKIAKLRIKRSRYESMIAAA